MPTLKSYQLLCRLPVSLFAACSAATGFLLWPYHSLSGMFIPGAAVFLLACGASALNQFQERKIDAKMERTRQRPLPARTISPRHALLFAVALIAAGLALLASAGVMAAAGLGVAAVLWYNGLYTTLKKITAFASVPGAIVGMIPPAMGWVSAGGSLLDPRIFGVCFVFFMWQIPHFWLQILHHGEDYEQAGLPSLTRVLSKGQLARITFAWICSSVVASLLLPLFGAITSPFLYFTLLPAAIWLIWKGVKLVTTERTSAVSLSAFKGLNAYIVIIMSLLSSENLFLRMQ